MRARRSRFSAGWSSPPRCSSSCRRRRWKRFARPDARCLAGRGRSGDRSAPRSRWRRMSDLTTLVAEPWADWGLIDCGNGQKLERYGEFTVVRPEPQAMWAPARGRLGSGRDLRSRLRRGRRRPLGPAPAGAAAVGAGARRRPLRRLADAVPPPRLLSRHGAAMGLDARALRRCRRAQPVRLHRRRHAAAERRGRAAGPCRRVEEIGRAGQGQCEAVGHGRPPDPLDRRRCRASSPRARFGAAGATTASCSIRPSSAAGPKARCGGSRKISRRCSPTAASCSTTNSRFLVLTVYAVRMSALAIGELVKQTFGDLGGTVEMGEMAVREEARGLLLPTAIFARWSRLGPSRPDRGAGDERRAGGQQQRNRGFEQARASRRAEDQQRHRQRQ